MSNLSSSTASSPVAAPVAIVTGASRGIGAAIAQRLAADGMAVVVNYAGSRAEAEQVVTGIVERGGRAIAVQADVSAPDAARQLFDAATEAFGGVDVLVNNAGAMANELPHLADTSDEAFDRLFDINVKGSFRAMREAARRLRHGGRIVNFSTSVIGLALPGYAVYAATKSAIETMTNILAKELRGKAITVNAVAPGPTATQLFLNGKTPDQVERLAKMAPLERLGQPEDIAAMVSVLAGPQGAWVNGQTVRVNGGIV